MYLHFLMCWIVGEWTRAYVHVTQEMQKAGFCDLVRSCGQKNRIGLGWGESEDRWHRYKASYAGSCCFKWLWNEILREFDALWVSASFLCLPVHLLVFRALNNKLPLCTLVYTKRFWLIRAMCDILLVLAASLIFLWAILKTGVDLTLSQCSFSFINTVSVLVKHCQLRIKALGRVSYIRSILKVLIIPH